jgi:DNA-binding CsgD family transcriptional regulator
MVGRQVELEAAERFLDSVAAGPAALVFQGEPGIGKTTVWRETAARAVARGLTLLACRPAQAEAKLSYAGLTDLVASVATGEALAQLPAPQRLGLEVALLQSTPGTHAPDPRVVYAAFSSLASALAEEEPVVVAVDDVQWLDRPSQAAVEFALRRLGERRIGFLLAERIGDSAVLSPGLARALDEVGAARLELRPLTVSALHDVLSGALGHAPPRPVLIRVTSAARGNPFYALEIARELQLHGALSAGEALPIPNDLSELVAARIRRLPRRTQDALLEAAALATPTLELLDREALERAEEAGLVQIRGERVAFAHPLFASAVYASAAAGRRRALHERLAGLVPDAEERARHLALAADGPSEEIALALEDAAGQARSRGSPEAAAELLELATRLTPPEERAREASRMLAAAEHHFHAGDLGRARALAEDVLARSLGGPTRGHALRLLGEIRYHESSFAEAVPLFEEALTLLAGDHHVVDLHVNLAYAYVNLGDIPAALPHARTGAEQAAELGDDGLHAVALAVLVIVAFYAGEHLDRERLEGALALEDHDRQIVMPMRPSLIAGIVLHVSDELERAEELFTALRQQTLDRGEDSDLPLLAAQLSMVVRRSGRPRDALVYVDEGHEIARMVGSATGQVLLLAERCHGRGLLGDVEGARADAAEAERLAIESEYWFGNLWTRWGLASLELALGNAAAAREAMEPVAGMVEQRGSCDPISATFLPSAIEGLIGVGELERAETLIGILEEHGRFHERRSALASAERARALVLAARGDLGRAREEAERALALGPPGLPFDVGRGYLVLGQIERRTRAKRAAREALERALAVFESVGAELWAERARAELERTGVRHVASGELTPTERRVAELAAQGMTNKQIGEAVFASPKTVEANLARAYRKLGIRTRAELGRVLAERERALTK